MANHNNQNEYIDYPIANTTLFVSTAPRIRLYEESH